MKNLKKCGFGSILFLSNIVIGNAQDFNLFQDIEEQTESRSPARSTKQNELANNIQFKLRGTSRFGSKYIVRLDDENGKTTEIEWSDKKVINLSGYSGYSLVDVNPRRITLMYPENIGCTDNPSKGVTCNGDYMILSMAYGEPLKIEQPEVALLNTNNDISIDDSIAGSNQSENGRFILNPFSGQLEERPQLSPEEEARRDERRARRAEMFRDFEVVRISDDDIPEGMQRVRTPFGDSLEPLGED